MEHNSEDSAVRLSELPPCVLHAVLAHLLHAGDLRSLALAASCCHVLQAAARAVLLTCTRLAVAGGGSTVASVAGLQSVLAHTPRLVSLDLRAGHRWVDAAAAEAVAQQAEQLETLALDHCSLLTAAGVAALCSGRLHNLRVLSLRSVGDIGDGGALAALPALRRLDLAWCHSVLGTAVASYGARLTSLSCHGCELVDDSLCGALPQVEELAVAFTRVGDVGLMALAVASPRMRRLTLAAPGAYNLWTTGRWTESGMAEFVRLRPDVQVALVSC